MTAKRRIGYQIVDVEGHNIHGDNDDPFALNSFDILRGEAADAARQWCARHPSFQVIPVLEGDIEEPQFVDRLQQPKDKS
jgi:hypothetical protein